MTKHDELLKWLLPKLDEISGYVDAIQGDWTDPRYECRTIQAILEEMEKERRIRYPTQADWDREVLGSFEQPPETTSILVEPRAETDLSDAMDKLVGDAFRAGRNRKR